MNLESLGELQKYLLGSHQRSGQRGRPMLEYMARFSLKQGEPDIGSNLNDYAEALGDTFVLTNYIQSRYQAGDFPQGYQEHDKELIQVLSDIQDRLTGLAVKTMAKFPEQSSERIEFESKMETPQEHYSQAPKWKEAKQILDSLVRFRRTYQVPFNKAEPENIRHLFRLYREVATMDQNKSSAQDREKVQWLIWATEDFHPLSYNSKISEARKKDKAKIEAMYYRTSAFLNLIRGDDPSINPNLPAEVLKKCEQAVDSFYANMDRYGFTPQPFDPHKIEEATQWLQEPEQLQLFPSPPRPASPSSSDRPTNVIERNSREHPQIR